jgi:uncharacterized protein
MSHARKVNSIDDRSLLDRTLVLSLNNAHAEETSALDCAGLSALLEMSFYARGIDRGETAFLIALDQNAPYANPNFRWFKELHTSFVYVDRIIVAASARGRGIARILYDDLFTVAQRAGQERIVCEVNLNPPNPTSHAFHLKMGFKEVGRADIHFGTKTVCYFERLIQ